MISIKHLVFGAIAAISLPATAQSTFESSGLGDIDPWGVGTLARSDGALPNTLWSNSDPEVLDDLFMRTNPRSMSPVARELVARAVLSSARRPDGADGDQLLRKRLNIIENFGDLDVITEFVRQMNGVNGVPSAFELDVDRQFARGNLASACSTVRATSQTSSYILNARAVCFALEGNIDSAELALELAREDGNQDIWFVKTIGMMGIENPRSKPEPKYDSGLKLALTLGADLDIPEGGFPGLHPALAAELANRSDIPRDLRIRAADIAAFAGVMDLNAYREVYRTEPMRIRARVPTITGETIVIPENEGEENPNPPVNPLDEALQASINPMMTEDEKAVAYRRAILSSRGDLDRYRVTALTLMPEVQKLRTPDVFLRHGDVFALAAAVANEPGLASRFLNRSVVEGGPEPDEFFIAWLNGIEILSGRDRSPQSALAVTTRLAETADEKTAIRAVQMIHMIMTLGGPASPEARQFLQSAPAEVFTAGTDASSKDIFLARAALESDALGEGAMRTALLIGRDPSALNMFALADLVDALKDNGFEDLARDLALEGIRYHRPLD